MHSGVRTLALRTAIEALRAGVPNRAAVRLIGSGEDAIEDRVRRRPATRSGRDGAGTRPAVRRRLRRRQVASAGLSCARSRCAQKFVVSRVGDQQGNAALRAARVFAAAMRGAIVPGRNDDAIGGRAGRNAARGPGPVQELERAGQPAGCRAGTDVRRHAASCSKAGSCRRTCCADASVPGRRQAAGHSVAPGAGPGGGARHVRAAAATEAALAQQRMRFAPLLFRAAGYAGWCVLLDEVELIGRYAPLQRALRLCRAGRLAGAGQPGRESPGIVRRSPPSPTISPPR